MYGRPWISASYGSVVSWKEALVLFVFQHRAADTYDASEDTSCPFLKNVQKCAETSYKSSGNKILFIIYVEENTLTFLKTARLVGQTPF